MCLRTRHAQQLHQLGALPGASPASAAALCLLRAIRCAPVFVATLKGARAGQFEELGVAEKLAG